VRERGRFLDDRATDRIDETRSNVQMHSRGCIWLPVALARLFGYWICHETYVRASRRHVPQRSEAAATTIMGYRYCGLSSPRASQDAHGYAKM